MTLPFATTCRLLAALLPLRLLGASDFLLTPPATWPKPVELGTLSIDSGPAIERGPAGTWESVDVLNPSVIQFHGSFWNYYSGFDGKTWSTGLACSTDGIHWRKHEGNPILVPTPDTWEGSYIAANGSAVVWQGKVLYFYQGTGLGHRACIGLASSEDGVHFSKQPAPVFTQGEPGAWDSKAVADPYVITHHGALYLYYLGMDELNVQRLGVAWSKDGIHWERSATNPILDVGTHGSFDENGLGEASVAYVPPYFHMLYTGRRSNEQRNLGHAVSLDGVHWRKLSFDGILRQEELPEWTREVVCDSTLLRAPNGRWQIWFGGGNRRDPAQNINGGIGHGEWAIPGDRRLSAYDANLDWGSLGLDPTQELRGSYGLEGAPGKRQAWVGPSSTITLCIPRADAHKLSLRAWVPAGLMSGLLKDDQPTVLTIVVNGTCVLRQGYSKDEMVALDVQGPSLEAALRDEEWAVVELHADRSVNHAKLHTGPDKRDLSFVIFKLALE